MFAFGLNKGNLHLDVKVVTIMYFQVYLHKRSYVLFAPIIHEASFYLVKLFEILQCFIYQFISIPYYLRKDYSIH